MRKLLLLLILLLPNLSFAQNWQSLDGPYGQIVTGITTDERGTIYTSSYLEGGFALEKNSVSWKQLQLDDSKVEWSAIEYLGNGVLLICRPSLVLRSSDYGKTWGETMGTRADSLGSYPVVTRYRDTVFLLYQDTSNGNSLYVSGDAGASWVRRLSPYAMNVMSADSNGRMVLAGATFIIFSDDHFVSTQSSELSEFNWFASLGTDSLGSFWITGSLVSGMWYSRDRRKWQEASLELPDTIWSAAVTPRGIAYMGSSEGVHTSTDGGATWTKYNQGLPPGFVASYLYVAPDGHLYVGTNGAGIFKTEKPVTGAYAVLPPQASVKREREHGRTIVDGERILILSGDGAHLSFRDVLGREVSIPSTRTERGFAIERSAIRGQVIFGVVETGEETRTIKLLAD